MSMAQDNETRKNEAGGRTWSEDASHAHLVPGGTDQFDYAYQFLKCFIPLMTQTTLKNDDIRNDRRNVHVK